MTTTDRHRSTTRGTDARPTMADVSHDHPHDDPCVAALFHRGAGTAGDSGDGRGPGGPPGGGDGGGNEAGSTGDRSSGEREEPSPSVPRVGR